MYKCSRGVGVASNAEYYKSQTRANNILQSPGISLLIPGKL